MSDRRVYISRFGLEPSSPSNCSTCTVGTRVTLVFLDTLHPLVATPSNIYIQVNGANGLTFYSLHDQFRGKCCNSAPQGVGGLCEQATVSEVDARLNNLEGLAREIKNMSATILSPTMHDAALVDPDSEHVWPEVQWIVKQGPSPASAAASSSPALELLPLQQQEQHATLIVVNTLNVSVAMRLMLDPLRLKKPQLGKAGGSNG